MDIYRMVLVWPYNILYCGIELIDTAPQNRPKRPKTFYYRWFDYREWFNNKNQDKTYKLHHPLITNGLALFSVNHRIRNIATPIFFGENRFTLCLDEGIISFLQDIGQFACDNIQDLRIVNGFPREPLEVGDHVLAKNFHYIKQHVRNLRNLELLHIGCWPGIRPALMKIDVDRGLHLAPPGFTWLHALAELRNLRWFDMKLFLTKSENTQLFDVRWYMDEEQKSHERAAEGLKEHIEHIVCQPCAEEDQQTTS